MCVHVCNGILNTATREQNTTHMTHTVVILIVATYTPFQVDVYVHININNQLKKTK